MPDSRPNGPCYPLPDGLRAYRKCIGDSKPHQHRHRLFRGVEAKLHKRHVDEAGQEGRQVGHVAHILCMLILQTQGTCFQRGQACQAAKTT